MYQELANKTTQGNVNLPVDDIRDILEEVIDNISTEITDKVNDATDIIKRNQIIARF